MHFDDYTVGGFDPLVVVTVHLFVAAVLKTLREAVVAVPRWPAEGAERAVDEADAVCQWAALRVNRSSKNGRQRADSFHVHLVREVVRELVQVVEHDVEDGLQPPLDRPKKNSKSTHLFA